MQGYHEEGNTVFTESKGKWVLLATWRIKNTVMLITPSIKDKVLLFLCTEITPEQVISANTNDFLKELNMEFDIFHAILNQFERFGFVSHLNLRRSYISLAVLTEAHDYFQKGGFTGQEELFKVNLEKLNYEIENLKKELAPDLLDKANKISGLISTLFSGLSLFK